MIFSPICLHTEETFSMANIVFSIETNSFLTYPLSRLIPIYGVLEEI